jgi:hypothetical protein
VTSLLAVAAAPLPTVTSSYCRPLAVVVLDILGFLVG